MVTTMAGARDPAIYPRSVRRTSAIVILVIVIAAVVLGTGLTLVGRDDGATTKGCPGIRAAYDQVTRIEHGGAVPTASQYSQTGLAVRKVALIAPKDVTGPLTELADSYARLGGLLQGFDAQDPSTYHVVEDNSSAVDVQQAKVDAAVPGIRTWLAARCA